MPVKHHVVFYPVGNGDSSQIVLNNGRRILMDFRHQQSAEDESNPTIDLAKTLRDDLLSSKRDYFDVVAFTHADKDHISGSTDFFELRHAQKYQGNGRIKIKELWVPAAMLLETADNNRQTAEFVLWRQEARHRLLEGKGIYIFSSPPELKNWLTLGLEKRGESKNSRDHLFIDAGTIVPTFSLRKDGVEFFCHSPFIEHCEEGDLNRNSASLIFNVRFNADGTSYDYLAIGDTEWQDLEKIVATTIYHGNTDRLAWNLLNIPHHCSHRALSDEKGDTETEPKPLIKKLLLKGKADCYAVSSSFPISNDKESYEQKLPPHIQARNAYTTYLKEVEGRKLLVTMEEPNKNKPEPLMFEITSGGVSLKRSGAVGANDLIKSTPPRAG
jgi:hypothetical protein